MFAKSKRAYLENMCSPNLVRLKLNSRRFEGVSRYSANFSEVTAADLW
jgi:hypothetical protein